MYEDMTFEVILQRMMNKVSNTLDKREGSIIYNALAPAAAELAQAYVSLSLSNDRYNVDTAVGEDLTKLVAQKGVIRKEATKAIRKGTFNIDVPIYARFNDGDLSYVVIEKINTGEFSMECDTSGEVGNSYSGTLIPIDYINGLTIAVLSDVIIPGEAMEDDERLRQRYYEKLQTPATSGNTYQYVSWAKEIAGIGYVKPYPRWNGVNSIKLVLLSSNKTAVADTKVQEVADYIEKNRHLGADVTIVSATEKSIDITVKLTLIDGADSDTVKAVIKESIESYFYELAFTNTIVRYTKIGESILNNDYVTDYENLTINNETGNIQLLENEIPVIGAIQLI